ncbi:hypothetical protein HanPSC8_Chr16g0732601 [Helianthus annuus]|nr:hypothetical protein HanPSC8_Chr16g0732601 [Helianthus annuus]
MIDYTKCYDCVVGVILVSCDRRIYLHFWRLVSLFMERFTVAAFKDLVHVVKLSISSGVIVCLELWYNAVLVLLAGYMANAEIAIFAFSIWYPPHFLSF